MADELGQSVFTEVLEVQVDLPVFQRGLAELEQEYRNFIQRIGSLGITPQNVLDTGAAGQMAKSLEELTKNMDSIRTGFVRVMSDTREQINETLTTLNENMKRITRPKSAGDAAANDEEVNAQQELVDKLTAQWEAHVEKKQALTELEQQSREAGDERAADFYLTQIARMEAAETQFRNRQAEALDRYEQMVSAQKEREYTQALRFDETMSASNAKMLEQMDAQWNKEIERAEAARDRIQNAGRLSLNSAYREAEPNDPNRGRTPTPANQTPIQATIATEERAYQQHLARLGVMRQKFNEAVASGDSQAQVFWKARLDSAESAYKAAFARMEEANAGFFERFTTRVTKNFPEFVAQILKYTIGFQLLFGTMSAIRSVFEGILGAFKSGVQFLAEMQERAADIKETLLENVVFSRNWVDNVKAAEQASSKLALDIQNFSAKIGIPAEKITAAFQAVSQNGGIKLLNGDMEKTVSFSATLLSLLRAGGFEETNQRRAVQQINSLLSGQVRDSNVILRVLGLSANQWKAIQTEAQKTGDLLGAHINSTTTLGDRLSAVNERLGTAGERWNSLVNAAQTYSKILLGTMAQPVFQELLTILQQVKSYYEQHKTQLQAIALTIGQIAKIFVELGKSLINVFGGGSGVLALFARMALYAAETAASFQSALETAVKLTPRSLRNPDGLKPQRQWETDAQFRVRKDIAIDKENAQMKQDWEDRKKAFEQISKDISALQSGKIPDDLKKELADIEKLPNIIDYILKPTENGTGPNDRVSALKQQFTEALHDIENYYRETLGSIDRDLANNTISHEEWMKRRRTALLVEGDTIAGLKVKYQELAQSDPTAKPRAKDRTVSSIGQSADQAIANANQQALADETRFLKEVEKDRQEAAAFKVRIAKEASDEYLKVLKAEVQAGTLLESEYLARQREQIIASADAQKTLLTEEKNRTKDEFQKRAIDRQIMELDQQKTFAIQENSRLRSKALQDELNEREQYARRVQQLYTEEQNRELQRQQTLSRNPYTQQATDIKVLQNREKEAAAAANVALQELNMATRLGVTGKALDDFKQKATEAGLVWQQASEAVKDATPQGKANTPTRDTQNVYSTVFGDQIQSFDDLKEHMSSFSGAVDVAATAMKNLPGIIGGIVQSFKSGGVAGGIGSIMSTVGSFIPGPVGAVLQIGGGILSAISGMFTAAARRIAEQIKKDIKRITDEYQLGQLGLAQTIQQLQQKRDEAVRRLSGKKGGKDELNKLLDQLDPEIAQLQKQQKDIFHNFEDQLTQLRVHDSELQGFLKTWMDINKQVKEYIDAGGSMAKAQEFLSLQLQQIRDDANKNLRDGEQQAIKDAIQLNDLLKQRQNLIDNFNKQKFDLVNADAIERRGAGAVSRGLQLAQAQKDFQSQLDDLNTQIDLQTKTVEKERQVFQIATDITELHQEDNALTLASLDDQISKWQQMKEIVGSIITDPATGLTKVLGSFLTSLGLPTSASTAGTTNQQPLPPDLQAAINQLNQYREANPSLAGIGVLTEQALQQKVIDLYQKYGISPSSTNGQMSALQYAQSLGYTGSMLNQETSYFSKNPQYIPQSTPPNVYTINVQVDASGQTNPDAIASSISDELYRVMRYGGYAIAVP